MPDLSKKLAEVAAFAAIGQELIDRGGEAASTAFGNQTEAMRQQFVGQLQQTTGRADAEKLARTTTKLRGMMETYIGDSWDDPVELLEWSGFYLGAAQVHWALVAGLAAGDDDLAAYARAQAQQFGGWLQTACQNIAVAGSK